MWGLKLYNKSKLHIWLSQVVLPAATATLLNPAAHHPLNTIEQNKVELFHFKYPYIVNIGFISIAFLYKLIFSNIAFQPIVFTKATS